MKSSQPQAPAVVKKSSPNGKLTIYLGKRDFISYKDYSENIDGILLIDPNYLDRIKKHKIMISLNCNQRFGQEDKQSENSSKFENQIFSITNQIYPGDGNNKFDGNNDVTKSEQPVTTTQLQNHILQKLSGKSKFAFPFYFKFPKDSANSVSIQSAAGDKGTKALGVSYEIRVWIFENTGRIRSVDSTSQMSRLEGILPSTYEDDHEEVSTAYTFGSIHPIGPKKPELEQNSQNTDSSDCNSYLTQKMTVDASCMQISGNVKNHENEKSVKPVKTDIFAGNPLNREVNIVIRKFYHHLNSSPLPPPETTVKQKDISLTVSLDKSVYRHSEKIHVKVGIDNQSGKDVKKVRVTAVQFVDMCLSTTSTTHEYKVDSVEEEQIDAKNGVYSDTFKICPLLAKCKEPEGFAVDGKLKTEETNLAGSFNQETGISVNYKIKVKVSVGGGIMGGTMVAEVPFDLCHFGKVGAGRVKQLQQSK